MSSDYNFRLAAQFIADTKDFESGVSRVKNDLNSIDAISKNSMSSMSTMMKTYGASITRMTTVPIIGGLTASYKMLAGYDEALRGLSKTTDLEGQALKDMGKDFEEMSRKIPLSVTGLLEIGEAAGQLGIENKNIKEFTKTIAALDVSTNLSKSQGASELAKFANVTQMSQDNFERLGSTIVELGNNLASTEADIVSTAQRLAGAGNIVGMTESQILAFAAALSSLGMEPEAAGSSMSRIIQGIEKYVATLSDELKVLSAVSGYSQNDFVELWNNDPTKGLMEFIEGLKKVKAEGNSVVKVLSDVGFSRVNDSRALQSLVSSGDMLQKSLELSNKAWEENTALQRESSIAYDSINSKIKLLGNNFAQIARIIGEEISPQVKTGMNYIKELTDKFIDMDKPQQSAIIRMASMSAAVGPAIYGFGSLLNILRPVTSLTYGLGNALSIIPSPLSIIGSGSRSASKGLNGFINGFSNFGVINSFGNSISRLNFSGVKQSLSGLRNPFDVVGSSVSKTMNSLEKFDETDFLKRQQKMTNEVNKNIKSMFKPEENAINKKYKKLELPIEKSYVKEVEYINNKYDRALSKNKRLGLSKNISLSDMAMREKVLLRDRKNAISEAKKVYNDALAQNGLDRYIDKKLLESKREKALSAELAKQSGIFNKHNKKIKSNIRANNLVSSLTSFFILPFKLLGNTLSNTVGIFGAAVRMIPQLGSALLSISKPVIGAGIFLSVKALQALSLIPKSMMAGFKSMLGLGGFALKIIGPITAIGAALSLAGLAVKYFEEPLKKAFKDIGDKGPLFINAWTQKITAAVPMFVERGIFLINSLATALSKNIPSFAKGAVDIISEISKTLTSQKNLKAMFGIGKNLVSSIFTAIENEAPRLLTTGFNFLDSIVGQFKEDPTKIGRGLLKNIKRIGDFVKKNVAIIFNRGSFLLTSLSDILTENTPYIIRGIGNIMNIIIDVIGENMPLVVSTGSHMINGIIDSIKGNLPLIKSTFGEVFTNAKEAIKEQIPGLQELWISVSDKLLPSFDFTSIKEGFKQSLDFTSIKEDFKKSYDDLKEYLFGSSGIFAGGSESSFVTMYGEVSQKVHIKVVDFIIKGLETLNKNIDTIINGGLSLILNGAGIVEKKVDNTVNSSQKLIPKMIDSLQTYNNKLIDEMSMENFKDPKSFINKLAESGFRTSMSLNKTDEDGNNIIHQVVDLLINAITSAGLTIVFGMFSAAAWLAGYLQYEFSLAYLELERMFNDIGSDFQILFTSIGKVLANLMTAILNPLDGKARDEGYNKNQLEYERKMDEINKASRERAIDFYGKVKPFQPNMTMPTGRNSFAKDFGEFTTEELARINEINIYMDSDKISKYTVPKTLDNINKQMAIEGY